MVVDVFSVVIPLAFPVIVAALGGVLVALLDHDDLGEMLHVPRGRVHAFVMDDTVMSAGGQGKHHADCQNSNSQLPHTTPLWLGVPIRTSRSM